MVQDPSPSPVSFHNYITPVQNKCIRRCVSFNACCICNKLSQLHYVTPRQERSINQNGLAHNQSLYTICSVFTSTSLLRRNKLFNFRTISTFTTGPTTQYAERFISIAYANPETLSFTPCLPHTSIMRPVVSQLTFMATTVAVIKFFICCRGAELSVTNQPRPKSKRIFRPLVSMNECSSSGSLFWLEMKLSDVYYLHMMVEINKNDADDDDDDDIRPPRQNCGSHRCSSSRSSTAAARNSIDCSKTQQVMRLKSRNADTVDTINLPWSCYEN